jgi:hypothetical protein
MWMPDTGKGGSMTYRKIVGILLGLLMSGFAYAADISGTWTSSFDTAIGKQDYTYVFAVVDSKLTGTAKSANGETALKDGKFENDTVTFVEMITINGLDLKIIYTGKVISNDEIKFTRDVSGIAVEELVAKRSK